STHITQDYPLRNEYSADRLNSRGAISMAKSSDPDSASSEIFFNVGDIDATALNINNQGGGGPSGGFTAFGTVDAAGLTALDTVFNGSTISDQSSQGSVFATIPLRTDTLTKDSSNKDQTTPADIVRIPTITFAKRADNTDIRNDEFTYAVS